MGIKDILEIIRKNSIKLIIPYILLFFTISKITETNIFYGDYEPWFLKLITINTCWIILSCSFILFSINGIYFFRFKKFNRDNSQTALIKTFDLQETDNKGENIFLSYIALIFFYTIPNLYLIGNLLYKIAKTHSSIYVVLTIVMSIASFIFNIFIIYNLKISNKHEQTTINKKVSIFKKILLKFIKKEKNRIKNKDIKIFTILSFILIISLSAYYFLQIHNGKNSFFSIEIKDDTITKSLKNRNFNGIILENCVCQDIEFKNCSFKNANLTGSDFIRVGFKSNIDFTSTKIENIKIIDCDLKDIKGLSIDDLACIPTNSLDKIHYPEYIYDSIKLYTQKGIYKYCKLLKYYDDSVKCNCLKK